MGLCDAALPQHEPALAVTPRATAAYFSLTTSLSESTATIGALVDGRPSVVTTVGVVPQQALAGSTAAGAAQHEAPAGTLCDSSQHAPASVADGVTVQHAVSVPSGEAEQTPVSGSTSSTRRAASRSPASAATTERTCS